VPSAGFDYKGEPTPYAWPDINSHFGIIDEAGFLKDRAYWYKAWWGQPDPPVLHIFPHWNDPAPVGTNVSIWAFSNTDEVELMLNGKSLGRKFCGNYSHAEWEVPYEPGILTANAYVGTKSSPVATTKVATTGAPVALKASFKDGFGKDGIMADGRDVALIQVRCKQ
jgi:beta-galactosidase